MAQEGADPRRPDLLAQLAVLENATSTSTEIDTAIAAFLDHGVQYEDLAPENADATTRSAMTERVTTALERHMERITAVETQKANRRGEYDKSDVDYGREVHVHIF